MNKSKMIRNRLVFSAMFTALIAVSGFFIIPLGPVPIVLKNLFVVLSGVVLGSFYGGISLLIFIAAGLVSPLFVFPGPGAFLTPLGGYIIGYFLASLTAGIIAGIPKITERKFQLFNLIRISIASFLGFAVILFCGMFYMMILFSMTLTAAFMAGVLPFIAGDLIKLVICIPLALKLRPIAARYINQ